MAQQLNSLFPALPRSPARRHPLLLPASSATTIKLSPKTLSFSAIGASSAKSIMANEAGFKGKFKAKNNCGAALKVSPMSAKGPKGKFKLTPRSFGTLVRRRHFPDGKHQATLKVTFSKPVRNALVVDPSTLNFDALRAAFVQTFAVSEDVVSQEITP